MDIVYYYKKIIKEENINYINFIELVIKKYDIFINNILKIINKKYIIIWSINPPSLIDEDLYTKYVEEKLFDDESGYRKYNKLPKIQINEKYKKLLNNELLTIKKRTYYSKLFNIKLKNYCNTKNIKFIDTYDYFITNNVINEKYINKNDNHIKMDNELCYNIYKSTLIKNLF